MHTISFLKKLNSSNINRLVFGTLVAYFCFGPWRLFP